MCSDHFKTNRTFSPAVLSALIKERGGDSSMLDRIVIVPCLDIIGVVEAIQGVMASYRKDTLEEHDKIGMVLIDNITNPISMLMQNGRSQGHDLMVCLARDLTLLSRLYSVCILVVNSTIKIAPSKGAEEGTGGTQGYRESAFADVRIKPALGSTWPHLMDFCLFIHPIPEDARRVPGKRGYIQEVIRSRVGGVGEWTVV